MLRFFFVTRILSVTYNSGLFVFTTQLRGLIVTTTGTYINLSKSPIKTPFLSGTNEL